MYQEAKLCQYPNRLMAPVKTTQKRGPAICSLNITWKPAAMQTLRPHFRPTETESAFFFKIPRWSVCSLGLKSLEFHEWALRFWMDLITASTPCWSAQCWQRYTHHCKATQVMQMTTQVLPAGLHAVKVISKGRWRRGRICHREKLSLFVMTLSCQSDQPLQKALINQPILC